MKKYKYKGKVVKPLMFNGGWVVCDEFNLCVRESDNVVIQVLESDLEEVCEFKRGDVLISKCGKWFVIYHHTNDCTGGIRHSLCTNISSNYNRHYPFHNGNRYDSGCGFTKDYRLATPSEKQQLFQALAKEGKYWDEDALEIKDFIRVPESIGIYRYISDFTQTEGDGLHIGFNDDKQLLWVETDKNVYAVDVISSNFKKVQCYLQPIKREDLKVGDTVYVDSSAMFNVRDIDCYYKVLSQWKVMCALNDGCYVYNVNELNPASIYKLIPIE